MFNIYPDAATAALLGKPPAVPLTLASTEAMRTFVPLADHVGPDPQLGGALTTFIRIAVSEGGLAPTQHPKIELLAHDPTSPGIAGATPAIDPNTNTDIVSAVPLFDGINPTSAALAYVSLPVRDNVYLLKVVIEVNRTRFWIRITNTLGTDPDDDDPRSFVWTAADSEADSGQPWIHATYQEAIPANVMFEASINQHVLADPIEITNFGTGPVTVTGTTPAIAPPFTISGLPITIGPDPGRPAKVVIGFSAPSVPGTIDSTDFSFVTASSPDPGPFGAGHNNTFKLGAHTSPNVWVTKAPMRFGRAGFGLAGSTNGKLYAAGGGSIESFQSVEEYTPSTDSWATVEPMPNGRVFCALAASPNGRLYAVGGGDFFFHFTEPVDIYDPASNTWTSGARIPTPRQACAAEFAPNGKLYVVGGFALDHTGQTVVSLDVMEEYDPATNTWAIRRPMPTPREGLGLAAGRNGRLYAVGGFARASDVGQVAIVEEYNPATNTWTTRSPMPTARDGLGLVAASNGKLYAVGGRNSRGRRCATVEEYDPDNDRWVTRAPMPTARLDLAAAAATNGKFNAVGSDGENSNTNEECTP